MTIHNFYLIENKTLEQVIDQRPSFNFKLQTFD